MKRWFYIIFGVVVWYGFTQFSWLCLYAICVRIMEVKNAAHIDSMTSGYTVLSWSMLGFFLLDAHKSPLPKKKHIPILNNHCPTPSNSKRIFYKTRSHRTSNDPNQGKKHSKKQELFPNTSKEKDSKPHG